MPPRRSNDDRLRELLKFKENGDIVHAMSFDSGTGTIRFRVKATDSGTTQEFTGTQVDAFIYGVRVGQNAGYLRGRKSMEPRTASIGCPTCGSYEHTEHDHPEPEEGK